MRVRRWVSVVLAGAVAVTIGPSIVWEPAAALDRPVVTVSDLAPATGAPLSVTVVGCSGTPVLLRFVSLFEPDEPGSPVPIAAAPGGWVSTQETAGIGDTAYVAVCPDGGRSAQVVVDVELRVAYTDPLLYTEGLEFQVFHGVRGTDCAPGATANVYFRDGEHVVHRSATPDAGGDWYVVAPSLRPGLGVDIFAECGGWYTRLSFTTVLTRPSATFLPLYLRPGSGAPSSAIAGLVNCDFRPEVRQEGVDEPLVLTPVSVNLWSFTAVAGSEDVAFTTDDCGYGDDRVRFDVEAPEVHLDGAGRLVGTDCPDDTLLQVAFSWVGGTSTASVEPDLFGDWSVDLPAGVDPDALRIEAACGSLRYAAIGDPIPPVPPTDPDVPPSAPAGRPPAAPPAAPASAVSGAPAYLG